MEARRNFTSYIRNDEGKHIVYDREGFQIGHWELNGNTEEYHGAPACALLPGASELDVANWAAVITTSYRTGRMAREAGAKIVYVLSGDTNRALGDGLKTLREKHKTIIIIDKPDVNGVIQSENLIMQRLGGTVEVRTPGKIFRKSAVAGLTKEIVADGMKSAEAPLSPRIQSLYGLKRSDRYDVEKIKTPWGTLNHHLYGGLPRGQVTLFCSKAGNGKSTMTLQLIGCALEQGHRVGLYSGESSAPEIVDTLTRQIAGRDHLEATERHGRKCHYVDEEAYADIVENVIAPNIRLISESYGSRTPWSDFKRDIVDLITHTGTDVLLIDNVMTAADLIMSENRCSEFEAQGLAAKWLEHIAVQYQVWVMTVAHLRKAGARSSADTNDTVSGASALVNAAGVVLYYERLADKPESTERVLKLTKNRIYGELIFTGIKMDYDPPTQRTFEADAPKKSDYRSEWAKKYDEGAWEILMPAGISPEEGEAEEERILKEILPGVDVKIRFTYPNGYKHTTKKSYSLSSAVEVSACGCLEGRRIYFRYERR